MDSEFQKIKTNLLNYPFESNPEELFLICERLGKGSFGAVYKATYKSTGFVVALKKCMPEDPEEIKQEIDIMKDSDHPNIIYYLGSFLYDGMFWIVMQYCALGSLTNVLKLNQKFILAEKQIGSVCKAILSGLVYLHNNGKIHRDVKPENFLIDENGACKLADFGVAGKVGSQKRTTLTGTPYYIAPEVLQEDQGGYDTRVDVWSLGICAVELAQGHPPHFQVNPMKVMLSIVQNRAPSVDQPQLFSRTFLNFINCCLIKDPSKRPMSHQLLEHPLLSQVDTLEIALLDLVEGAKKAIKQHGGLEKALQSLKELKSDKTREVNNFPSSPPLPKDSSQVNLSSEVRKHVDENVIKKSCDEVLGNGISTNILQGKTETKQGNVIEPAKQEESIIQTQTETDTKQRNQKAEKLPGKAKSQQNFSTFVPGHKLRSSTGINNKIPSPEISPVLEESKDRSQSISAQSFRRKMAVSTDNIKKKEAGKKKSDKKGFGKLFSFKKEGEKKEKQEIMAFLYGNE